MIKDERLREQKRKRRHKALLISFLTLFVVLAVAFGVIWKVFRVETIIVSGNELYEDTVITDTLLDDKYSWNSLYVYLKYKFTDIDDIPFIDTVKVTLKSPTVLEVEVYEKGVMGYLYDDNLGQNVYFDKDGIIVEISDRVIPDVPAIKGLAYEEIDLYEKLSVPKGELSEILTLTQTLKRSEMQPDIIIFSGENAPVIVYENVWVQLGGIDALSAKVEHLEQILPSLEGESGVLHLESWTEGSQTIVFDRDE